MIDRSQAKPLVLALLAVSALGVAATTLETTLTTDPDDEINPNWDRLPIGQEDAAAIEGEIDAGSESDDIGEADDETASSGEAEQSEMDSGENTGQDTTSEGDAGQSGMDTSLGSTEQSVFDWILGLLATLARFLLPLIVIATIGTLIYRYRAALLSLFGLDSPPEPRSTQQTAAAEPWPTTEPTTVVDRAWLALVKQVNPDDPKAITTGECAALASQSGCDVDAVEAITTAFERVHYGGATAATEADRAQYGLDQLTQEKQ